MKYKWKRTNIAESFISDIYWFFDEPLSRRVHLDVGFHKSYKVKSTF